MSTCLNLYALLLEASTSCTFISIPFFISVSPCIVRARSLNNCPSQGEVDEKIDFYSVSIRE